jgi:hypothetical protein
MDPDYIVNHPQAAYHSIAHNNSHGDALRLQHEHATPQARKENGLFKT